jgi:hypothetical protein
MKGIDVIIPVHKYNEDIEALLARCVASVKEMAIIGKSNNIKVDVQVVGIEDLPIDNIMNLVGWSDEFNSFNVSENTSGELDFCSQVNFAVNNCCKNDYFMVVELDDMVTPKWLTMALPYVESRKKCPVFLPLVEVYDIVNPGNPLHYVNEIGWSSSFAENELGSLSNESLKDYCNFNITGAIFKKSDFTKAGGLKPSMKLSFGYELLLRLANLYNEVYVVPKVGYYHFVNREDSLTSEYHKTMTQEEGSWWIKLATQEYHFKKDRNKTYSPNEEE